MIQFQSAAEKLEFAKILNRLQSYATSELGKRAAEHLSPISSLDEVARELTLVDELKRILESEGPFPIDGLRDNREALQRSGIENSILKPADLLSIALTLQASRNLKTFIQKRRDTCLELASFVDGIATNKILEFNITQAIDENGLVRDNASKELKTIRNEIVSMYESLRKQLQRILRSVAEKGLAQDEIITTRDGRMVIPVKVEEKHQVPGFIHSSSATGSTVFIEPAETLALNNEIRELHFKELREIEKILRALTSQVGEVHLDLLKSLDVLAHLDLVYAKARYSIEIKGNKPFLKESGSLKISQARHPILLLHHSRETIVPLSIEIGNGFTTLLITGPNSGGKSVAMKTVGILVLMVQSGIHVPSSPDSEFPIFTQLHVDIGDDQSIENDLSTFTSHVARLKEILLKADSGSLVLVDEIGAGTDPVEGGALAAAILRHLTKVGAFTIATTHQVALKAFAHETEGMENGAMEFDQKTLLPTYHFRVGVPGSSYALEIAKRLGISSSLISEAEVMAGDQKSHLEKLILDLENRSQALSKKLEAIDLEKLQLNELVAKYETKLKSLQQELKVIKSKAVEEAKAIISKANSVIERSVKEIRQSQAEKSVIRESKSEVQNLEAEIHRLEISLTELEPQSSDRSRIIGKGSRVQLKSNSQVGEVVQVPDANGQLQVAFDNFKMKVHINDIVPLTNQRMAQRTSSPVFLQGNPQRELDVRGFYGDDAVEAVDKFIDTATVSGLHRIDIIHGKGTGVLRKRINAFLQSDTRINSHRLGEWNEGGAGVTVVELKV